MTPVRVSVVVPVFDPGPDLDRCVDSLLSQSLAPDAFEVVFVDDGSTDDAPARLDRLAAEHANVRVIHTPNSGWPGRPRNLGIEAAVGDYIQFLDQDDRLGPEALERLIAMADRNGSDIVIGKVSTDFRPVNQGVFRENREACTIHDAPLIDTLTPHKLFRRSLLLERGLRFPEGRRRLEDQLFVVRAYFAASVVSILADYPCYYYLERSDRGNAGSAHPEPFGYFGNVREVLDVVLAHTEPGPERDRLVRRFVRIEMLARLSEPLLLAAGPDEQAAIVAAVAPLLRDVGTPGVLAELQPLARVRARLVTDDRPDAVVTLATRASVFHARCRIDDIGWVAGQLRAWFRVELVDGEDRPLVVERRGERLFLDPRLTEAVADPVDVTDALDEVRIQGTLAEAATLVEWRMPVSTRVELVADEPGSRGTERLRPITHGVIRIHPGHQALGHPLTPGTWEARLRLHLFGLDRRCPLGDMVRPAHGAALMAAWLDEPPAIVRASLRASEATPGGASQAGSVLTLDVTSAAGPIAALAEAIGDPAIRSVVGDGRIILAELAVAPVPPDRERPVTLVVTPEGGAAIDVPAALIAHDGRIAVRAEVGGILASAPTGPAVLDIVALEGREHRVHLGRARIGRGGRLRIVGAPRLPLGTRLRDMARRWFRRLPSGVQRPVRAVGRRVRPARERH